MKTRNITFSVTVSLKRVVYISTVSTISILIFLFFDISLVMMKNLLSFYFLHRKTTRTSMELFSLETDDRTDEDRAMFKATRKDRQAGGKTKAPMDTDLSEDHGDYSCQVRINLNFSE